MSYNRNRSEGWKYAKISGHANEEKVLEDIILNNEVQQRILHVAGKDGCIIKDIEIGGLKEKSVESVFGDKTKSKSDLKIHLSDGSKIGISVKKSLGGQVYLISPERFILGFEKQFNKTIPQQIKRAISLFWGSAEDTLDIVSMFGSGQLSYEKRKHRLTGNTLKSYDENLYINLLKWFDDNIIDIFVFCFSSGLAINVSDWADLIWYKNDLKEIDVDYIINIEEIKCMIKRKVYYGNRTGGSTIQLPFGFVQWHSPTKKVPGEMQFHHSYECLISCINEYMNSIK